MNTGHGGSMSTVHANTPSDSLRRIESLCLMSSIDMPLVAVRAQVASAINFIVCCERLQDGSRKTIAVSEVLPLNDKGDYRTQDLFLYIPVAKDEDGKVLGYHAPTGILPTFLPKARAYGFGDLTDAFFDPRTYGVPPPPLIHGLGENVTTHWAPSLKHRDKGQPDPEEHQDEWRDFEDKLKSDAKTKRLEANKSRVQVRESGFASSRAVKPEAEPATQVPTAAKPKAVVSSHDATPPPTRNPLLNKRPPREEPADEPSVQVSAEVDDGGTEIKMNPLNAPRRQAPVPVSEWCR
jgi:pilus assembly protein CpaF